MRDLKVGIFLFDYFIIQSAVYPVKWEAHLTGKAEKFFEIWGYIIDTTLSGFETPKGLANRHQTLNKVIRSGLLSCFQSATKVVENDKVFGLLVEQTCQVLKT